MRKLSERMKARLATSSDGSFTRKHGSAKRAAEDAAAAKAQAPPAVHDADAADVANADGRDQQHAHSPAEPGNGDAKQANANHTHEARNCHS